jgi:hypothetical protein
VGAQGGRTQWKDEVEDDRWSGVRSGAKLLMRDRDQIFSAWDVVALGVGEPMLVNKHSAPPQQVLS